MAAGPRAHGRNSGVVLAGVVLAGVVLGGCMPDGGTVGERTQTDQSDTGPSRADHSSSAHTSSNRSPDQVVVLSGAGADRAEEYQALTREALARVEDLWGADAVARPVRLVLPADGAAFAALTGHDPAEAEVPASTVGSGAAARVVVHPDAWDRLTADGRLAVITHEVTHLAMQGDGPVPQWLGEGLAEYTAHRATAMSPVEIAGSALDGVRDGDLPTTWPGPAAAGPGRWDDYAPAWLACLFIAETYSEEDLLALYHAVADGQPWDEAVVTVLGEEDAALRADWRSWLTELVS